MDQSADPDELDDDGIIDVRETQAVAERAWAQFLARREQEARAHAQADRAAATDAQQGGSLDA